VAERPPRWLPCETGASWLDLVATVGRAYGPAPVDRLTDPARLADWLATQDLTPRRAPTRADLTRARTLRESLRTLALATRNDTPWPPDALATLNTALADDTHLTVITPRQAPSGPALRPPATAREALARLAREAAVHLTGPAAGSLHQCADETCGMLYLDPTGRRRWCSAEICGVRNRVRAHRRRAHEPE
jgi:predicted RNA-binding Zn ribbon-like protein